MNFGPYPEKRELPSFVQKQSGEELALKLLRQHDALDALHRKELSDVQKQADRLAEQLALLVHKKRFTENDPFVMSLRQLLKNEGIILRTYVGEEVTDTLEDEADIVEWLPPGEDTADRVVDALEPEIHWHGQLLHRAKLSCRQAAEEADEDVAEETPEELTGGEAVSKSAFPGAEEIEPAEKTEESGAEESASADTEEMPETAEAAEEAGAQDQAAPSGTAEPEDAEESSIEEPAESSEETAGAAAELAEAAEETASEEPEEMPEEAAGAAEEAAETAEAAEEPAGDSIDDESQAAESDENSYVDEDSYDGADSGEEEYFDDEGDFDDEEYFDDEGDSGEEEYFDDGEDIDDEEDSDDEEDQEEAGFFRRILDRISSWLSGES